MADAFSKYIPDFEYELIRVHEYTAQELVDKGNELSLIMLLRRLNMPMEEIHSVTDLMWNVDR